MPKVFRIKPVKWLLSALALVAVAVLVYFGVQRFRHVNQSAANPMAAIPEDAVMAVRFADPLRWWNESVRNSEILSVLIENEQLNTFERTLNFVDSSFREGGISLDPKAGESFWVSLHRVDSSYDFLFLIAPAGSGGLKGFPRMLESMNPEKVRGSVRTIKLPHTGSPIYYSVSKGLFIASCSRELLERSLIQYDKVRNDQKGLPLSKLSAFAGKNVEANMFLSTSMLRDLSTGLLSGIYPHLKGGIFGQDLHMELDLSFTGREINGAGYTVPDSDTDESVSAFRQAGSIYIHNVLPSNTSSYLLVSPGDFRSWHNAFMKGSAYSLDSDPILSWVEAEVCAVWLASVSGGTGMIAGLRASNIETCRSRLAQMLKENSRSAADSLVYRNYTLGRLAIGDPLGPRFGDWLSCGDQPWFALVEDYAFFSSDPLMLQRLIDDYLSSSTLMKSADYSALARNITKASSVMAYVDGRMIKPTGESHGEALSPIAEVISKSLSSGLFAIQWVADGNRYYTNFSFSKCSAITEKPKTVQGWQLELASEILHGPYSVKTHRDNDERVLLVDAENQLCFIDNAGKLLWRKKLQERPFGAVQEIDLLRNGRIQYLLNSSNYLYIVDANGNDVAGYPKKLRVPAMNPVALFDYEKNKDYRLVYCGRDKKLHNLGIDALPTKGWNNAVVSDSVLLIAQHLRLNDNDVIILRSKSGQPYFLDRRGNTRITPRQKVTISTPCTVDASQPRHRIVFRDSENRQVIMTQGGDIQRVEKGSEVLVNLSGKEQFTPDRITALLPSVNLNAPYVVTYHPSTNKYYLINAEGRWIYAYPLDLN